MNIITLNFSTGTSRAVFAKKMHLNQIIKHPSPWSWRSWCRLCHLPSMPAVVWHLYGQHFFWEHSV